MDPVTTVTFASSSLVPWPNALSVLPDGLSMPVTRLGALTQSVLPAVLTTRLPSLPSNVLPARLACAGEIIAMSKLTAPRNMTASRRLNERGVGFLCLAMSFSQDGEVRSRFGPGREVDAEQGRCCARVSK